MFIFNSLNKKSSIGAFITILENNLKLNCAWPFYAWELFYNSVVHKLCKYFVIFNPKLQSFYATRS